MSFPYSTLKKTKWHRARVGFWLALSTMAAGACVGEVGCDFDLDDCDTDFDCGFDQVCESDEWFEQSCVDVIRCEDNGSCPGDSTCVQREGLQADHPFEQATPGKQVCSCLDDCFPNEGGSTSTFGGSSEGGGGEGAFSAGGGAQGGGTEGGGTEGGGTEGGGTEGGASQGGAAQGGASAGGGGAGGGL